jgi:hypothetical protein
MLKNKKGFSIISIIVIVLVVVAGGALTLQYWPTSVDQEPITQDQEDSDQPVVEDDITVDEIVDETSDWETYRNEEYGFEIKHPENWSYTQLEVLNDSIIFGPEDIIIKIEQSLDNITSDKLFLLMFTSYDSNLYERGILPYRRQSNEFIKVSFSDVSLNGLNGTHYISEFIKDKGSYIKGDKTATVDVLINDNYISIKLSDYQYNDIFKEVFSSLRSLE